jgi:hypothetical protein
VKRDVLKMPVKEATQQSSAFHART